MQIERWFLQKLVKDAIADSCTLTHSSWPTLFWIYTAVKQSSKRDYSECKNVLYCSIVKSCKVTGNSEIQEILFSLLYSWYTAL